MALSQPATGYRVAIDTVLLAAAAPAGTGERVLDAGCGVGAAALCLAARTPDCTIAGVEINPDAASLAQANVAENAMEARIAIATASFIDYARTHAGAFDHVMTNPPYHPAQAHAPSPDPGKAAAHGEAAPGLDGWIKATATALTAGGRLTLIQRADRLGEVLAAIDRRFGAAVIFPLWPRAGIEAGRVIVRAVKGRRTRPRLMAGLVLHRADGGFTPETEAILRDGAPLDLGDA